ncbi:MAG: hypothetical protein NT124_04625 [Candidatus Dependentiae bacterium]|nr:hypothetical protein [Candidatus Dependentiae bacterium]
MKKILLIALAVSTFCTHAAQEKIIRNPKNNRCGLLQEWALARYQQIDPCSPHVLGLLKKYIHKYGIDGTQIDAVKAAKLGFKLPNDNLSPADRDHYAHELERKRIDIAQMAREDHENVKYFLSFQASYFHESIKDMEYFVDQLLYRDTYTEVEKAEIISSIYSGKADCFAMKWINQLVQLNPKLIQDHSALLELEHRLRKKIHIQRANGLMPLLSEILSDAYNRIDSNLEPHSSYTKHAVSPKNFTGIALLIAGYDGGKDEKVQHLIHNIDPAYGMGADCGVQ